MSEGKTKKMPGRKAGGAPAGQAVEWSSATSETSKGSLSNRGGGGRVGAERDSWR